MIGLLLDVVTGTAAYMFARGLGRGLAARDRGAPLASASVPAPAPAERDDRLGRTALLLSLAGLCCAPFSLGAVLVSVGSLSSSRAAGRRARGSAAMALVLGLAATVLWGTALGIGWKRSRERDARRVALEARLAGRRAAPVIDEETACAIVEERVRAGLYEGRTLLDEFRCEGPYEASGGSGRLRGVALRFGPDRIRLRACLARAERWFVLALTDQPSCPAGPWALTPAASPGPELERTEEARRKDAAGRLDADRIERFRGGLDRVREAWPAAGPAPRACADLDLAAEGVVVREGSPYLRLATVDLDALRPAEASRPRRAGEWDFLTSDDVRVAVDASASPSERAAALRRIRQSGGPYLVAYSSRDRSWPEVSPVKGLLSDDARWTGGEFDGWMSVLNLEEGRAVCAAPLRFESSRTVTFRRRSVRSKEDRVRDAAVDDLKDRFETAATDAIRDVSGGRLRLGYKLLE